MNEDKFRGKAKDGRWIEVTTRFIELGKNQFYAASNIASFNLAEEEAE